MQTLALLGCDRRLVARIVELLPARWHAEELGRWHELVRRLSSESPPDVLLFTSIHLTEPVRRSIVELRKKGYFVPAAVYLPDPSLELAHFAGRIHRHGVEPIFGDADLDPAVERLLARAAPGLGSLIANGLGVTSGLASRLLALLEADPRMHSAPPSRLADALGASRSALYRALRSARLPPPGELQAFFRLWPGLLRIKAGGRGEDAAFEARRPDYPAFRKAVARHLGMTVFEVRRAEGAGALLRRWAAHHTHRQVAGIGEAPAGASGPHSKGGGGWRSRSRPDLSRRSPPGWRDE
jgi:hypothetical protein